MRNRALFLATALLLFGPSVIADVQVSGGSEWDRERMKQISKQWLDAADPVDPFGA